MKIDLSVLNAKIFADLKVVGVQAQRLGYQAYLVGGVVRDVLLKRKNTDWDIVVEGDAIELAKAVTRGSQSQLTVYDQFSTATVAFANGVIIDLATARCEHYPHPGALPVVKPGIIKQDLFRRDFTINALAVALNPERFGELLDFYSGCEDLKNRKVRILHDQSFVDDPTRILRAVRFEKRLGFRLETKTLHLLKAALTSQATATVKPPRYFAEFRKILSEPSPSTCLKRLAYLGGLDFVGPPFNPDWKMLTRIEKSVRKLRNDAFYFSKDWSGVFLLAVFSRFNISQAKDLAKHFHLTKAELLRLSGLEEIPGIVQKLQTLKLRPSEIYENLDPLDLEIIFFIRVSTSVNMVARRVDEFLKNGRNASLQITGEDLKSLGIKPGRAMGALLHALLLNKIDGNIKTHQEEISLAKQMMFYKGV